MRDGLKVLMVGGGMIAHDQLLPALYQLQRLGLVGEVSVCAQTGKTTRALAENEAILEAFPGHSFTPYPDWRTVDDPNRKHPALYEGLLATLPPRQLVMMALPDQLHFQCTMAALEADQHVIAVKPLVLKHAEAVAIERAARERGLFVGVEYHKRFDDRALLARQAYRAGKFGEFRLAQAALFEPWYYRHSNFQNWCTCDNTDLFTYVGCHYVDQIAFITGCLPVEVSLYGIVDAYPNGAKGYLWTDARVLWDNGACLNVINGIGYPDAGAGSNHQGLRLFGQGKDDGTILFHDDQYRGIKACFSDDGQSPKRYQEYSPDYLKLVYRGGTGMVPVGYGYRSVEALIQTALEVEAAGELPARQAVLARIDAEGIIATPGNSAYNELVIEAARLSVTNGGRPVRISYGDTPGVAFREW